MLSAKLREMAYMPAAYVTAYIGGDNNQMGNFAVHGTQINWYRTHIV